MADNWFSDDNWKTALSWQTLFIKADIPSSDFHYQGSFWENWVDRIIEGEKFEVESLSNLEDRLKTESTNTEQAYADHGGDLLADGHLQLDSLTNSMYAALVVSLWSKMEYFLKNMIEVCSKGLKKKEKTLNAVSTFCSDSLNGQLDKTELKKCIKVLKGLQLSHYKFDEIKKFFKKEMRIDIETFSDYPTIDAIRILNNTFKHNDGFYKPISGENHTEINQSLLNEWAIQEDHNVDYHKLPIKDLVIACGTINCELIEAIELELTRRNTGN